MIKICYDKGNGVKVKMIHLTVLSSHKEVIMLDFRVLTFLTVCKCMNFTRAARELNITQPAVSQHIKFIEDNYNVKLFNFEGKKMSLSKEGEFLFDAFTTMNHDDIHIREELSELATGKKVIYMGVTLTIGEFLIPDKLTQYLKNNPDVSIKIIVNNTHRLLNLLNDGLIDFALVEGYFEKKEYDYRTYSDEKYVCVAGADYAIKDNLKIQELLLERLIIREEGSGTREIFERFLAERNCSLSEAAHYVEINSINAIKQLVGAGCGITFLYERAVAKEIKNGELKIVNVKNMNVSHEFTYIWRKGSIFSDEYRNIFEVFG